MTDYAFVQESGLETIDPLINGRIRWLVSALGGPSADDPETYVLGDDVLGCLRDLKRWLRGYDEKLNRLDVARCISETSMVKIDLMEILSHCSSRDETVYRQQNKISLACVELLVPLTWRLDKTELTMTLNHHRHIATLKRSQISYKQAILRHSSKSILKACCMNALPAMATQSSKRTPRDDGIVRLILYLIRNLLQIESTEDGSGDIGEDVSRSSTIEAFETQGIFDLLLSVVAGIPEIFEQHDMVILEVLFYLIQGIDCEQLSVAVATDDASRHKVLSELLQMDDEFKGAAKLQSRHNRFGTTVVVQKESGQRAVLAGHGALVDEESGLQKLDTTKKWRKPHRIGRKQAGIFGTAVSLSLAAQVSLRKFLVDVLHCGFSGRSFLEPALLLYPEPPLLSSLCLIK
ncbi:hypothetical protein ABW21_db0203652 [Orbilia brochopaga]|nr:hypothetical protein ABW21_db0203652 [Drechslerella brochopaga]